jgi:peptidoglycan-associated lipoprotein
MRSPSRSLFSFAAILTAGLAVSACKPTYPKCEQDEHCKEKGEFCLNGTCQECKEDANCVTKRGAGFECKAGRCEQKAECKADGDCAAKGADLVCRGSKCVAECTASTDCPSGKKCDNKKCVAECAVDVDCGPSRFCIDGACSDQPRGGVKVSAQCRPMNASGGEIVATETVRFEFDQFDLTAEARQTLDKDAECLKQAPAVKIVLEGHADERGTQEYNLALGEKRSATVQSYLKKQGIEAARMVIRSKGENQPVCEEHSEACWSKNRRVEFIQSTK